MSDLLRLGSKNEFGKATPIVSDADGFVNVSASGRYVPHRSFDHIEKNYERKRILKNKYVEDEFILLGNNEGTINQWVRNASASKGTNFELDPFVKDDGECSVKLTNPSGASYIPTYTFSEPVNLNNYDHIRFWASCDDLSKFETIQISFQCPDASNVFQAKLSGDTNIINEIGMIGGRGEVSISLKDFVVNKGTPDLSNAKMFYISIKNKSGETAVINFANIKLVKSKVKRSKIILRIDDGLRSVYDTALPIFEKYNVMGTCFVNPYFVAKDSEHKMHVAYGGTNEAMNLSELHELHDRGWSICSHTWKHNLYNDPTVDKTSTYPRRHYYQAYKDLASVQDWLIDNGFGDGATSHVYGNHYYNPEVLMASLDLMVCDYSVHPVRSRYATIPWAESIPHLDAIQFCTPDENGNYPVIDALLERGGLAVPMFHRFDGDGVDGSMSADTLDRALAYICSKDNVDIITASDLAFATPVALR